MAHRLTDVADELYTLAPDDFVAARDAAARRLREAGERDDAAVVKQWRRPSQGAWLVNQVARAHGGELAELLDLGTALREAQDALDGAELRAMSRRRHQVIRGLSQLAERDAGRKLADTAQREFEATLDAALADEAAAAAVRTGRLMRPLTSTGLEPVDLTDAVAVPEDSPAPRPAPARKKPPAGARDAAAERRKAAHEEALVRAEAELERTQAGLADCERVASEARAAAQAVRERVAELEQALDDARTQQAGADRARRDAEATLKAATRARDAAQRTLDTARKRA